MAHAQSAVSLVVQFLEFDVVFRESLDKGSVLEGGPRGQHTTPVIKKNVMYMYIEHTKYQNCKSSDNISKTQITFNQTFN